MAQLVLLVVAAAWAAVLIPPMLRSRVENRPNSSVTDFRRQLNKLQSTATPSRPAYRALGRPLAPSPLQRPAAQGRPGVPPHRQVHLHGAPATRSHGGVRTDTRREAPRPRREPPRMRSHGAPTGSHERPHRQTHMRASHAADPRLGVRRRRSNVLFVLVLTTACTLFLAATTPSTVMVYAFALSFLALCGYVLLLAQLRQREAPARGDDWFWHN
jgi:hypothetical protein